MAGIKFQKFADAPSYNIIVYIELYIIGIYNNYI